MLQQAVADFVRREAPNDRIARIFQQQNGYDVTLFRKGAEAGWLGLMIPERYGGQGGSVTDAVVAFEELGRAPMPGPFFSSGILAPAIVEASGSAEHAERLLPGLASGEIVLTLAGVDSGLGWGPELVETTLSRSGGELVLNGRKAYVHDAEAATGYIVLARDERGVSAVLVERGTPGVTVSRKEGLFAALGEVAFDNVRVPESALIGQAGRGWDILETALERVLLVLCSYKVGGCQQIFDFTVEYSRERVVFGQPIGRFQRVQDHIVDLADSMDSARLITWEALWKLESGKADASAAVHEAKAVASQGYYDVCNFSHMVHAGPGTALEHPLMQHSLLSRALYQYLGDPAYHKRRMMDALFPRA